MSELNQSASTVNPAVARCTDAWNRAYRADLSINQTKLAAMQTAGRAFCEAMPQLDGYDNIRDFIACCAQGLLLGAIDPTRSAKLLYAAQVALSTFRQQRKPGRPAAS